MPCPLCTTNTILHSDNGENTAMLLPRFTIRALLVMLTVGAVASVIIGMAFRGQGWAWGASIGLLSLFVTALVHAAWFGTVWMFTQMPSARTKERDRGNE